MAIEVGTAKHRKFKKESVLHPYLTTLDDPPSRSLWQRFKDWRSRRRAGADDSRLLR